MSIWMFRKILPLLFMVLIPSMAFAYSGSSPSWTCTSWSDCKSLIEGASVQDGDDVAFAAGSYTASSTITIPNSKKLTLTGAGKTSTNISASTTAFVLGASASKILSMGFTSSGSSSFIVFYGDGTTPPVIGECKFQYTGGKEDAIVGDNINRYYPDYGDIAAVIYNCEFIRARITFFHSATYNPGTPSNSFRIMSAPINLGTANAVYVEDCTFTMDVHGNVIDTNFGGNYVFRFNDVDHNYTTGYVVEMHSIQGNHRATRFWEVYGNTLSGANTSAPASIRAGTGVFFDNSWTGTWDAGVPVLDNRRSFESYSFPPGTCNGSSSWDGNDDAGWPCRDQIGRGADSSGWTNSAPYPDQNSKPAYFWGNTAGPQVSPSGDNQDHIVADRDFFKAVGSFNGSSGVGTGTYAQMQAITGTTDGVGYWVTDRGDWNATGADGQLWVWNDSAEEWEFYYEPYDYPHPLRGEEVIDETPPNVNTASIGTNGITITINFSETVVTTGYDNGDFDLDCSVAGNGIALNSISGTGSTRTFTAASTIGYGDVCNLDYTGTTDEIEDEAGNDLVAFQDTSVTNNVPDPGDTTPPVVTISTSDPQAISEDSLSVSGTASDAVGVTSCKYRIGAAPDDSNGTALSGTTTWSGTASGFSEGANTLYCGCTDAAGNWGSDSITVNYTLPPPSGVTGLYFTSAPGVVYFTGGANMTVP